MVIAAKQLRAAANRWYKLIPRTLPEVQDLWDILEEKYGTEENCDALQELFYSRTYKCEQEDVGNYILKQEALYKRFTMGSIKEEQPLINRLLRQMPKEIRPFLVTARCQSIKELTKTARMVINTCPELTTPPPKTTPKFKDWRSGNAMRADRTSPQKPRDAINSTSAAQRQE